MPPKKGKTIIPFGSLPEPHELKTANFFNKLGYDVEFLVPVDQPNRKTPDIRMRGLNWEIKAPIGNGKHNIQHSFKDALRQSRNIIFDMRRSSMNENKSNRQIKNLFDNSKIAKRVLVITQSLKQLDLER
ncbi:MAG: hypothetical protein LBB93_00660 [Elusimicrobiota bacterium]|jgi:hypothetical protein|nr:hypothetical protein [Elusimicrobiota bacterium]